MSRSGGKELERAILDQARRLLLSHGYSNLSMRRIASEVGCTATSIYLYFENKDALVHQLIDEGMELLFERLSEAAAAAALPSERLEALCRAYVEFGLSNPEYYEAMFMLPSEPLGRYPAERYRRARRNLVLFAETLTACWEGESGGEAADAVAAANVLWTSLHGLVSLLVRKRIDVALDQGDLLDVAIAHATAMAVAPPLARGGSTDSRPNRP